MRSIAFRQLPLSVRLMTAAAMALSWVFIEEKTIEPFGLSAAPPFYRVGDFCPYDAAVLLSIVAFWLWAHAPNRVT